jgi:hypothetical protein
MPGADLLDVPRGGVGIWEQLKALKDFKQTTSVGTAPSLEAPIVG